MKDVGIAIIDIFGQSNLDECYKSLPKDLENIIVVSNTRNKLPENCLFKKTYSSFIPFATLRNCAINFFRENDIKHFFIINSNQVFENKDIINDTIKIANTFGLWFLLGPSNEILSIEDDVENISLKLSDKINSDFIYLHTNIVSKNGFFDERYFNTKDLDVLDFILRLRNKNIYTPSGFIPFIDNNIKKTKGEIQKINHKELNQNEDISVTMSYAYFLTTHKYIPTQNDPKPASNEELMKSLDFLQKNYSKKL